ncbi:MAG TPA: alanine racemase [Polyangiaceae bacterium]|nr:alanine racemase [Polyangiaceae bacterium]
MSRRGAPDPALRARLDRALGALDPPYACLDLDAFFRNAADLRRRAAGRPIRVATKSVRCRELLRRLLAGEAGFRGLMAFTLPEALWLAEGGFDDVLVAYPTVDRGALGRLVARPADAPARVTLTVDAPAQLDLIASAGASRERPVRVCLDVDASFRPMGGRLHLGVKRSPLHAPAQAARFAAEIARRPYLKLVGLMAYEAQIAGLADEPPGRRLVGAAVRAMQRRSAAELAARRAEIVRAVRAIAPLEFVNGGGTGSLERTAAEPAVTELAAGSGLFGPTLFDAYRGFSVEPAALFALPVVRRPGPGAVTVLGGGYVASGAAGADRLPSPFLPAGLRLDPREGAGEVQTPLLGPAADGLRVGDRVYFRHAKAGELCERFDELYLVRGDALEGRAPTYRGEGRCFL